MFVLQTPFVKDLMYDTCRPRLRCMLQHSSQSRMALFTEAHAGSARREKKNNTTHQSALNKNSVHTAGHRPNHSAKQKQTSHRKTHSHQEMIHWTHSFFFFPLPHPTKNNLESLTRTAAVGADVHARPILRPGHYCNIALRPEASRWCTTPFLGCMCWCIMGERAKSQSFFT